MEANEFFVVKTKNFVSKKPNVTIHKLIANGKLQILESYGCQGISLLYCCVICNVKLRI